MIDIRWFNQICCLAAPTLGDQDREQLCAVLGDQEEVLPYLLVSADAFKDWPLTRAAIRSAVKSTTKVTSMRPQGAGTSNNPGVRRELREALSHQMSKNNAVGIGPDAAETSRQIRSFQSGVNGRSRDPHIFIDVE